MAFLYLHIPFCISKCDYCSFNSYSGMESLYPRYVRALKKEIVEHFCTVCAHLDLWSASSNLIQAVF